jgi:nucleotide-binding universal stress UspA family protein
MVKLENILFLIEDEVDLAILGRAANVAEVYGARLTVTAVVPPARSQALLSRHGLDLEELERLLIDDRRRQLDEAVEKAGRAGVETNTVVLTGSPLSSTLRYIHDHDIDYLTKAPSPSDGLRKQLFGSIDLQLMRAAPCMVGIGRPRKTDGPLRAVVAVDSDVDDERKAGLNRRILDAALMARAGEHAEIYVIHSWDLYGSSLLAHGRGKIAPERLEEALEKERVTRQEWLDSLIETYRQTLSPEQAALFDPRPLLLRGDSRRVIPKKVRELDADLLVLGTASRSGLGGLMIGNTAEEILHRVNCTVVVNKPEGFKSPFG